MPHHEHAHHEEHRPPPPPPVGPEGHLEECPCSQCRRPMSKEEEIRVLEDYKRHIGERLDHVERRLEKLQK